MDRRLLGTGLLAVVVVTIAGVIGYVVVESYSLIDALYMTVITLSTVGFREVHPLSTAGKILTIVLIMFGFGMVVTAVSLWTQSLLAGDLRTYLAGRRKERMLDEIKDHFIVCGYGHFGKRVVTELEELHVPFLVIDQDVEAIGGSPFMNGDATDESMLRRAHIERARGLLTTFSVPATNVYTTLTAKEINPDLTIVARSESPADSRRLARAGAAHTVSTYDVGGARMAQAALNPRVVDFVDMVTTAADKQMSVVEVRLPTGAPCLGVTPKEAGLEEEYGVLVLGVIQTSGKVEMGAKSTQPLAAGDIIIAFGEPRLLEGMVAAIGHPG
jgi:voltage-gated potassium channel